MITLKKHWWLALTVAYGGLTAVAAVIGEVL